MTLLQKVALLAAVVTLILGCIALIQGEIHDAALGFFLSATTLFGSGLLWPVKPMRRSRKG